MQKTILVVDDEKMITTTLSTLIKMILKFNVMTFNDPTLALKCDEVTSSKVDLIISDFMMPGMNGIEFLSQIKKSNPEAITILLTGYADKENAIKSINEVGLYYYLEKPWDNNDLIKIIQNGLEKKNLTESLKIQYDELLDSKKEVERLYELLKKDYSNESDNIKNLIVTLTNVIEAKDKYTEGHTRRVATICRKIGSKLGMDEERVKNLEMAGLIHDIGKVGVAEAILNKPGRLTPEEFESVKKHSEIGENICKPLNSLNMCADAIRHHHEKLDGSGYPDGLIADEISLEARIMTVADIFDALYSERPYREKLPLDKVKEILNDETSAGKLDIIVVKTLYELLEDNITLVQSGEIDDR